MRPANGENRQANPGNNQNPSNGGAPARDIALERPQVWWRDSNWWLVIIAGLTGGVIAWQSLETKKAAAGEND